MSTKKANTKRRLSTKDIERYLDRASRTASTRELKILFEIVHILWVAVDQD
jgi:hypothetical protein